jgi:integrase
MAKTLSETWQKFLAERSISLSPTSICTDYNQVSKWVDRCPVQKLKDGREILMWILQQKPEKASRRVCMFIRCMYKWAASEDVKILKKNPVANFKMPKAPQKDHEIRIIPKNELNLIMIALASKQSNTSAKWEFFAEFMLQTGMRTGEVRALKWSDIDWDENRVLVHSNYTLTHGHKNSTKTNKKRWVPLNNTAKEIINKLDKTQEYLFPWNRSSFQDFFRVKVDQLYDAELVKHRYRPYDLRHVAISRWLEAGIPVTQCAAWAGNTSEVIWQHYAGTTQKFEMPVL